MATEAAAETTEVQAEAVATPEAARVVAVRVAVGEVMAAEEDMARERGGGEGVVRVAGPSIAACRTRRG